MSLRRRVLNVRTIGSLLFGLLLLFLLFRVAFGEDFDWSEVGSLIRGADPTFLLLAFLAYYATFPLRGYRWKYVLSKDGDGGEAQGLHGDPLPVLVRELPRAQRSWATCTGRTCCAETTARALSRTVGTVFVERIADIIVIAVLALTAGFWSFRGRSRPRST